MSKTETCINASRHKSLLHVCSALNPANYIVALGEEGDPVVESRLFLVIKVLPVWPDILGLGRSLAESARGVLASEHWSTTGISHEPAMMVFAFAAEKCRDEVAPKPQKGKRKDVKTYRDKSLQAGTPCCLLRRRRYP